MNSVRYKSSKTSAVAKRMIFMMTKRCSITDSSGMIPLTPYDEKTHSLKNEFKMKIVSPTVSALMAGCPYS